MQEYIMSYNLDDTGKLINAKRIQRLIRCKKCIYADFYTAVNGNRYCYCTKHGLGERVENDFCSYGQPSVFEE